MRNTLRGKTQTAWKIGAGLPALSPKPTESSFRVKNSLVEKGTYSGGHPCIFRFVMTNLTSQLLNIDCRESPLMRILATGNCPNQMPVTQKRTPMFEDCMSQISAVIRLANCQDYLSRVK